MSKKVTIAATIGRPVEESDVDPLQVGPTSSTPPEATDVEAQWHKEGFICGRCGAFSWAIVSETVPPIFRCWHCTHVCIY